MTITETPAGAAAAPAVAPAAATGFAALVATGDPRTVARLYIATSLLFLLLTGVTGALVGAERLDLDGVSVLDDALLQVFTLHSIGGVFLVALPLLIGLLAAVVPLQLGASTVAFPRALASSYWVFLVSGGLVLASYGMNGGPFGGDAQSVDLFVASFVGVVLALSVASLVIATTVLTLRAPGMSLRRAPLLSWSSLVASVVWLLTLPVLAALMVLVYVDHRYGGQAFMRGSSGVYDQIAWAFRQPTLYAFAIPVLGVIGDIVPVFSQRRHQMHGVAMTAIGLFGALAIGSWVQLGVGISGAPDEPLPALFDAPWFAVSVAALLPLAVLLGLWALTARAGAPKLSAPLLLAGLGFTMLGVGVVQGALGVWEDFDLLTGGSASQTPASAWTTSQSHYVLAGIAIAAVAGLVFWAPKIWGVLLPERAAQGVGVLLWLGTIVLALPDAITAIATPDDTSTVEALNAVSLAGGALLILGALALVGLLVRAVVRRGEAPGDDPWSGHTLEWATSSPPAIGAFASLPAITSEAPLYDARHGATSEEVSS